MSFIRIGILTYDIQCSRVSRDYGQVDRIWLEAATGTVVKGMQAVLAARMRSLRWHHSKSASHPLLCASAFTLPRPGPHSRGLL